MAALLSYRIVTDAVEAERLLDSYQVGGLIGLDTETFWDAKSAHSRVSLVQLAAVGDEVLVFDALSTGFEPLRLVIEDPSVRMAAHNARFDQTMLRGESLSPASFVDTLSLARAALRLPSHSLAAVAAHLFGIPLDKTYQNSNWQRRPLTRAQLDYAAQDARVTLLLYEELKRRLEAEGGWEEALRAALISDEPSQKSPRRKRTAAPTPPLTTEEKHAVVFLKRWRLERANSERVPAYMICPDRTLEYLAHERPTTLEGLRAIHGLGESKITKFGEDLLAALREAIS